MTTSPRSSGGQPRSSGTEQPPVLRRRRLAAWWEARGAVQAGASLADYLAFRASQYMRTLAARGMRLPIEVSLDGRDLRLHDIAPEGAAPSVSRSETADEAGASWEAELARRHGPDALADLAAENAKARRLDEQIEQGRTELDRRRGELADALASGKAAATGDRAASAHLRPEVPSPWPGIGLLVGSILLVLAEGWQLVAPFLNSTGIDANDPAAELRRAPLQVVLVVTFGMGATATFVWFAHVSLARTRAFLAGEALTRRQVIDLVIAGAVAVLSIVLAGYLGSVRHASSAAGADLLAATSGSAGGTLPVPAFVLLTSVLPYFSAVLLDSGLARMARRAECQREARRFDADIRGREEVRERLEERIRMAAQDLLERQAELATCDAAIQRAGWLGKAAVQDAADEQWLAGEELARAREELRAVLEVDRFAFLKEAGRSGRGDRLLPKGRAVVFSPEPSIAGNTLAREAA